MDSGYKDVITRYLRHDERLILSEEQEMPLVIEAKNNNDSTFLNTFLTTNSKQLIRDISQYGAVLLRGFDIGSDSDFEKAILAIQGLQGISEAFMSEQGRIHASDLQFVLHTNAVYKTGGTLYLGGFHSENYYSPDVPAYICFCCLKPSDLGGETGLINMEKVYPRLEPLLQKKLEKNAYFVSKWLISDVAKRYNHALDTIEECCKQFDLPIIGEGDDRFILMYKPSVYDHPDTEKKALQINLFELPTLNKELRKCFMNDYRGKDWFWHRFVWKMPKSFFSVLERLYIVGASLIYSPKESFNIMRTKLNTRRAQKNKSQSFLFNDTKVGQCFNDDEVKDLAQHMRTYYCSILWKKGDILLVDNRKVVHAGMPGKGSRLIRAMICNPIDMRYSHTQPGTINCANRKGESIGHYLSNLER